MLLNYILKLSIQFNLLNTLNLIYFTISLFFLVKYINKISLLLFILSHVFWILIHIENSRVFYASWYFWIINVIIIYYLLEIILFQVNNNLQVLIFSLLSNYRLNSLNYFFLLQRGKAYYNLKKYDQCIEDMTQVIIIIIK